MILGIGIAYLVAAPFLGNKATFIRLKNGMIPIFVIALVLGIIFLISNQQLKIENIWIIFSIFSFLCFCYVFISWHFQRRKAGVLLAKIGFTRRNKLGIVLSLLFGLFSSFQTWEFLTLLLEENANSLSINNYIYNLIYLTPLWLMSIYFLVMGLDTLKLRQNGICHTSRFIEWQKIKSISWDQSKPTLLIIRFSSDFPFLSQEALTFQIPKKYREKVNYILKENCPTIAVSK